MAAILKFYVARVIFKYGPQEGFSCTFWCLYHNLKDCFIYLSRVAQGAYLEVEYIRNVLSVSGTLKYADSGTA